MHFVKKIGISNKRDCGEWKCKCKLSMSWIKLNLQKMTENSPHFIYFDKKNHILRVTIYCTLSFSWSFSVSGLPEYYLLNSLKKEPKTNYIWTRKIQSGNAEFSIKEGFRKDCSAWCTHSHVTSMNGFFDIGCKRCVLCMHIHFPPEDVRSGKNRENWKK